MAPLAEALHGYLGSDRFRMVLTEQVPLERLKLGFQNGATVPSWVVGPPKCDTENRQIEALCLDADVAVMGYGPIAKRIESGKLTLVMSERLLKKPWNRLRMLYPRYAKAIQQIRHRVNYPNAHELTIGYYAPDDLKTLGAYSDRIWNWAYFTEMNPNAPVDIVDRPLKMLWVGRMLGWKRCDLLLRALRKIQDSSWFESCWLVGEGVEKARLLRLAAKINMNSSRLHFEPPMPFQQIRSLMRESDVYVLPSNRHEGWGVVVNEAMSEGCIVVANQEAGASRMLIDDGRTGLLFRDGDVMHLAEQLARLGTDYPLRMRLRRQAWKQIQTLWHPRVGAERLIALCQGLLGLASVPEYSEGPCSRMVKE